MRKLLTATILICLNISFASAQVKKQASKEDITVFEKVEINAHTDGVAWQKHIKNELNKADTSLKNVPPGSYTVVVQFVVDVYGNLTNIKAAKDPGYGLGDKAVKIVQSYRGTWKPANQCGRNVKSYKKETMFFTIASE
jgi:protein TonB